MIFRTRKVVKPGDLNSRNTLFGGRLLEWIDEECGVYAACQMNTETLVTKSMTAINFLAPARQGDVVEIGVETVAVGHCTISVSCHVRTKKNQQEIISIDEIVFVNVDDEGRPIRHGKYKSKSLELQSMKRETSLV
ncbi:acyl-CoA thioesterase [Litorimonas taeanensis]